MDNCSKHKKEVAGISDMKVLAEMIGDLHYGELYTLLFYLYKKLDADAERDNIDGKEKTADALQYLGMSIFESSLRAEKLWNIVKPYMEDTQ